MKFKEIKISELKNLDDSKLIELYKESLIWLKKSYMRDKEKNQSKALIEKLIEVEDEMVRKDIPLRPKHYCEHCEKFWNNDAYCPHSFDQNELWKLYRNAKFGKIEFSSDNERIKFYNKEGKFVGEYKPNE